MIWNNAKTLFKLVLQGAVFTALFACSSERVNEPAELQPFIETRQVEKLWSTGIGDGDEELKLELRPVLSDGKIFALDRYGELNVVAADSGKRLWRRDLNEQVSAGLGFDRSHLYYATFQGELVCLDRENGNEIWRRSLSSEAVSAPASNNRSVAVQTIDGKLFVFDAVEGIKLWQYDSTDPILTLRGTAQPTFHKGALVAAFANGELRAFDARNGRSRWKSNVGVAQGRTELERLIDIDGDPLIFDDKVYAVAYQGNLVSLDVFSGQELWRRESSSFKAVALANDKIVATLEDSRVLAYSESNAIDVWENDLLTYRRLTKPTIVGDSVLVADFEGFVHVLSLVDGSIQARFQPDTDGIMEHIIPAGDRFFISTRSGDLIAYKLKEAIPSYKRGKAIPLGRREDF